MVEGYGSTVFVSAPCGGYMIVGRDWNIIRIGCCDTGVDQGYI